MQKGDSWADSRDEAPPPVGTHSSENSARRSTTLLAGSSKVTSFDPILDAVLRAEMAADDDRFVVLCFIAGRDVTLAEEEVNAAVRRSELLLAAGGDPRRPLELHGRAVTALADDLDGPEPRRQLAAGLSSLATLAAGIPATTEALAALRLDGDLAWRCYAMALFAERLADTE